MSDHGDEGLHQLIVAGAFPHVHHQVSLGHFPGAGGDMVESLDEDVEVVFDSVEVAVVGVGDDRWHVSLGDPLHVLGRHIQGADDGVQGLVKPSHDLSEISLVSGGVGPDGQFSLHRGMDQGAGVGNEGVDIINAVVEVDLDLVEVTVVLGGDLLRDIPLADPVHVGGGHVQGTDDGVQGVVEPGHDPAEIPQVFVGVDPGGELPFRGGAGLQVGVGDQGVDVVDATVEMEFDLVEVAMVLSGDLLGNIPPGDPVHVVGGHVQRGDDGIQSPVEPQNDFPKIPVVLVGVGPG